MLKSIERSLREENLMAAIEQSASTPFGIADHFNPFSAEYLADPYPILTDVREAAPVFYSADLGHWVITRYSDVRQVFRTSASFSAVNALEPLTRLCPAQRRC
jgi:cytochrome P450